VREIDLSFRLAGPAEPRPERPARLAVAGALVLHAALALWLMADWRRAPAPEAPIIVATLVRELPPEPKPAPAEPQQKLAARSSGPGERTTAPPLAQEVAPEPEAPAPTIEDKPVPPAPPAERAAEPIPPAAPEKPKPRTPPRAEPHKDQLALRAPMLMPPRENRALGEKDETGDPYLNMLWARIERNREQTTPIGPSGLHLEGITVYEVVLDHGGHLRSLYLVQSSGSPLLDDEARRMIIAATPFPPLPTAYPERTSIKVTIRLFPQ
jgi:periplasmic protein TonB